MRRLLLVLFAASLGAGSYLVYHHSTSPAAPRVEEKGFVGKGPAASPAQTEEPAPPAEPAEAVALPGPILSEDDRLPADSPESAAPAGAKAPAPRPSEGDTGPSAKAADPGVTAPGSAPAVTKETPPAPSAPSEELDGAIRRSQAALQAKDPVNYPKSLREVFQLGKDRSDVNIVPQVRALLDVEERGAGDRPAAAALPGGPNASVRLELCRYLEARDADPAWKFRSSYILGAAEALETIPETIQAAWKHLSQAYALAPAAPDRQKVLSILKPFVEKNIFSKRYSPLVETYTVKPGDSLNRISRTFGTTEEAIWRLNQLKGDIIQPGKRLILLVGKPRIQVKKSEFRLWLNVGERFLLECSVGLGKENSTPKAVFTIRDRMKEPVWYRPGEPPIPYGDPKNILGTRWLGFKNTEDLQGFGIHGTSDPLSIGKEASSGCIRMRNDDLELLWDLVPVGTEVEIFD